MKHRLLLLFFLLALQLFSQNKNQSIGFKENKGQIIDQNGKPNTDVKYLLNSGGLNVQLKKNGFSYDIYEVKKTPIVRSATPKLFPEKDNTEKEDFNLEYIFHRVDIDFVNSNSKVELITEQKSADFDNYYNVPNQPEGVLEVHQYQQITYKNIYPNIDVVFTIPEDPKKAVEYNFVIHPKGKISDIQLKFNGAKTDLVDNKIKMNVRFGKMEETIPASWIEEKGRKKEIIIGYQKLKKDVYGFRSANFLAGKTVVIDPTPVRLWGTYYGEGESNYFGDIDTDSFGNIYFTGYTSSTSGIYATSGAHQTTAFDSRNMQSDAIIVKFDPSGKRVWGTFYGGESWDRAFGLKIDKQNNVVITGTTDSKRNISTAGAYLQTVTSNTTYAFLAKFNSSGTRLWATYMGNSGTDSAEDVDIDSNDNIYIVGSTNSYIGFSTNNNFQTLLNHSGTPANSLTDGFLSKFNPNGDLVWSTYVGGESNDYLHTIKVASDYLILGGKTFSLNYISTSGTFQETNYKNGVNGTVYKFSLDGNRIWSTYYGSGNRIKAVVNDDENNVYIGGDLFGSDNDDNIASPGSFDDYNRWSQTGFLAKLNKDGQRIWGTYLGTSSAVYSLIFKNNHIYIGGEGGDQSITTPCAYKRKGFAEGYIGKFTKSGSLVFGTYVNGFDQYSENKICFENNNIVIGGTTAQDAVFADTPVENNKITDSNSYQQNLNGRKNFYLINFSEEKSCNIDEHPSTNSPVCLGETLAFKADSNAGYNYLWTGPNGFTSTLSNPTITNPSSVNNGEYRLVVSDDCNCEKTYTFDVVIGDTQAPVPNILDLPTISGDCHTEVKIFPKATDKCAGTITATTADPLSYSVPGTYTIKWDYDDGNGNRSSQNQTVIITNELPEVNSSHTFCVQQNANLSDIPIIGQNIKWFDTFFSASILPETTLLESRIYYVSQAQNDCESERLPITVKIQDTPIPIANSPQEFCIQKNVKISDIIIDGQNVKWYESYSSTSNLAESTTLENGITYYASQTISGCESDRIPVAIDILEAKNRDCVNLTEELPFPKFFTPNGDGYNDTWTIDPAYLAPNSSIRIFDRYGKLVKELALNTSWNGTYLGNQLPASDYWFTVTRMNGAEYRGHFSLKR